MPGLQQIGGHAAPHGTQADEADPHHLASFSTEAASGSGLDQILGFEFLERLGPSALLALGALGRIAADLCL